MDVKALQLFAEIARRGSFAAVARDRGEEPSKVSRVIAQLEDELGFRLFQRSTRRMALTEAGSLYLARAMGPLEDLASARDDALALQAEPIGRLRLTSSVAFGVTRLVPMLADLRQEFPRLEFDFVLTDNNLDLVAERIDLAIRLGSAMRGDVIESKLVDVRYIVCAAPAYIAQVGRPTGPSALADHQCLMFGLANYHGPWLFRAQNGTVTSVAIGRGTIISNAYALYLAAKLGIGPALMPDWLIADDLAQGNLIDLFPDHRAAATDFDTAIWLLYPSRAHLPSKVRAIIDFLRRRMVRRGA